MTETTNDVDAPRAGRRPHRLLAVLAVVLAALLLVPAVWAVGQGDRPLPDGAVTLEGVLSTWHGDGESVVSGEGVELQSGGRAIPLRMSVAEANRHAGRRVKVRGRMQSGVLVPEGGGATTVVAEAVVPAPAAKTVAVILVNFTDNTSQPWTAATVENTVIDDNRDNPSSVRAYYEESSDGAVTITGKVFGWYGIDDTDDGCDYRTWAGLAKAAASADAAAQGIDLNSGAVTKVYAFPNTADCAWSGLGELPGDESWIDGSMSVRVVAHELGHNFGVHHASTVTCTDAARARTAITARLADDCTLSEYGDPFSVMGASTRTHHGWQRSQLGYPVGAQTVSATAGYDATHAITALEPGTGAAAVRLLRIQRGTSGTFLDLETRGAVAPFDGFAATDPAVTGVSARIGYANTSRVQSQLIDGALATSGFADAPLGPGASLWDPVAGVTVTVVSVAGGIATVRVRADADAAAPTAPGALTGASTGGAAPAVTLGWTAATDDRLLAGYEIRRNGVRIGVAKALSYTDACIAGQSCALAVGSTYAYEVYAYDAAGKLGPRATVSVLIPGSDTVAPSMPTGLTSTDRTASSIALAWSPSTDNSGGSGVAGYEVFRGAALAGTVSGISYTDTGLSPGTTYVYTVRAYDVQGNRSAASAPLTVSSEPAPGVPTVVSTTASGRTVTVTYTAVDAFSAYDVRRETYDSRKKVWGGATIVTSPGVCGAASCAVSDNVAKSGTYRYSARARNGAIVSDWSLPGPEIAVSRR